MKKHFTITKGPGLNKQKFLALTCCYCHVSCGFFLLLIPEGKPVREQFLEYMTYIVVVGEIVLMSVVIWFITHPATIYIKLTESEFCSFHPNFNAWTFSVSPHEIVEIEHSTDRDASSSYISVKTKDGASYLLSPNYPYNRNELYRALSFVNPNIKLPMSTWLFASKR